MRKKLNKIFLFSFIISLLLLDINIIDKIIYEEDTNNSIILYSKNDNEDNLDIENEYIGILSITSIDLKHGFYHPLSTKNKLKSGIKTIKDDMEDVLILASHSGKSNIAKFNKLRKMNSGDEINLSYNKKNYKYQYDHSYSVRKTGHIFIKYDQNKKALILITCDLNNNNLQTVYVSYMI